MENILKKTLNYGWQKFLSNFRKMNLIHVDISNFFQQGDKFKYFMRKKLIF